MCCVKLLSPRKVREVVDPKAAQQQSIISPPDLANLPIEPLPGGAGFTLLRENNRHAITVPIPLIATKMSYQLSSLPNGSNPAYTYTAPEVLHSTPDPNMLRVSGTDSKGYFLTFCSLVSSLAALSLSFVIFIHVVCILAITHLTDLLSACELIYRMYGIVFALIGLFCEMEWTETIRNTSLLQSWTTRGAFYIFVALFTMREYAEITLSFRWIDVNFIILLLGSVLTATGVTYSLMVRKLCSSLYDGCDNDL